MNDTLFLFLVVFTVFVAVPTTVLVWQTGRKWLLKNDYIRIRKGYGLGNRAALEAYLFIETDIGLYLDVFQVILSMISCACFVAEMYHEYLPENGIWQTIELCMGVIFAIDYIFRFYLAKDKIKYFFSPLAIIDFITVLPTFVFAAMALKGSSVTFLRVLRLMRALRVLRVLKILRLVMGKHATAAQSDVTRMCVKAGFTVLCMIFCAAAFFAIVEGMDFHVALYYVCIEALSRPNSPVMTVPGYCMMYTLVILTITALPPQLATVVVAFKNQTDDTRLKLKETDSHVVLCGDITHYELSEVFDSLFADTSLGFRVCIMMPKPPNVYMKRAIDDVNGAIPGAVTVIIGTVMAPSDLANAQAKRASRIVVFSQVQLSDKAAMDRITMARAMAIKCFAPMVPLCCMVLLPETRNQIAGLPKWRAGRDQVICVETIKMQLMALNVFVPGSVTLISNLVSAADTRTVRDAAENPWEEEYVQGVSNSIFQLEIPLQFTGHAFTKVAWSCFCKYGVMLIGLGRLDSDREQRVVLNPGIKHVIKVADVGYWVCESQEKIDRMGFELANSKAANKQVFDVTVDAVFAMLQTPDDQGLISPFDAMGTHGDLEHQVALQMSPRSHRQSRRRSQKSTSHKGAPSIARTPNGLLDPDVDIETKLRREMLREFCSDKYDNHLMHLVHDAFQGSGSEWVWCSTNQEMDSPGMKIGSPLLHSRTQSFGELSWDEEEDGQPDELQVRENVIICGSSYSIKYLVHCLVAGGCKVTLVNPHANAMLEQPWAKSRYVVGVKGAPDDEKCLLQAGMATCYAAIVLGHENPRISGIGDIDAFIQDTQAVTISNVLAKHPSVFMMLEIVNLASVSFLTLPNTPRVVGTGPSLSYAGGRIYSPALSTQILARVHTLPDALQIVEQLLWTNLDSIEDCDAEPDPSRNKMALSLVELPQFGEDTQRQQSYGELAFHMMMSSNCIPLGIFRQPPSHQPYVICNPPATTKMSSSDQLYVINCAWSAGQKLADTKVVGWTPEVRDRNGARRRSCPLMTSADAHLQGSERARRGSGREPAPALNDHEELRMSRVQSDAGFNNLQPSSPGSQGSPTPPLCPGSDEERDRTLMYVIN